MASSASVPSGGSTEVKDENLLIVDDLVRARAADTLQEPLLHFPKSESGVVDYESFTGKDIDRFVDQAAKYYVRCGLQPTLELKVVAQLGHTDVAYIVTFLALSRLGYVSFCLTPRLAPDACAKLLAQTKSIAIIQGRNTRLTSLVADIRKILPLHVFESVQREDYDKPESQEPHFTLEGVDKEERRRETAIILHSSGSTGLPKPIYLPHTRLVFDVQGPKGHVEICTLPFFHVYGNFIVIHGMQTRKSVYMYNPNLPLTADLLIQVMESVRPDTLHTVPYALELLGASDRGVEAMRSCAEVLYSGSTCPDDLGNELTKKGVNIEMIWGATEIGYLGTSFNRPPGDDAWDYFRVPPPVGKHVEFRLVEDDKYEGIFLQSSPLLSKSNSNDPPGSFHTNELFRKHPTIPNAWKPLGRLDDRLALINGEKVLPLPMEARIRKDPLIREALIFGAGKSIPGLLVFRSEDAKGTSDAEFIDAIWPTIKDANAQAETFAHISKETTVPIAANVDYPKTDKESIKRSLSYDMFQKEIEAMYDKLQYSVIGTLQLDVPSLEKYVMETFKDKMGVALATAEDDFFAAGVNSLQAIQMRGLILKDLDLGSHARELGQNAIFDTGNAARLAKQLYALRLGKEEMDDETDAVEEMAALIEKYSTFKKHTPGTAPAPKGHVVVLTGATGSLGAYILAELLSRSDVLRVYCLVRGENPKERVLQTLKQRGLEISDSSHLSALTSDLSKADLGISHSEYQQMQAETTTIIHSAWAVNFNLGIRSFEDQHIKGVHNLVQFSLSVSTANPARFFFCSSISTALATIPPATITQTPTHKLTRAPPQGYARSKLVSEHIVRNAAINAGARTRTFRIGQVVGDRKLGLWNDTEAIPLIIRSALALKALPALDETESWLPVDTLAATIVDLAGISTAKMTAEDTDVDLVYNLENPQTFHWTSSLLAELQRCGLEFSTVPMEEWVGKLREYEANGGDAEKNPAVKLIGHFEKLYLAGRAERKGQVRFEISRAERDSEALRKAPRVIEDGYVRKFVDVWRGKWEGEGRGLGIESSG